jgi:imidazolonepropionase-like amidohydrolase
MRAAIRPRMCDARCGTSTHGKIRKRVLYAMKRMLPAEALRAATLNPALFLHMSDRLGSITSGKFADLVLLDDNPLADIHNTTKIRAVIADGRIFNRAALDKVLEDLVQNRGTGISGPKQ